MAGYPTPDPDVTWDVWLTRGRSISGRWGEHAGPFWTLFVGTTGDVYVDLNPAHIIGVSRANDETRRAVQLRF